MSVVEFMGYCIGCGIVTRWLCGWVIAALRLASSLVDSVTR